MFSRKQMIKLLAPLIVEQIMAVLVGMVDVVMVAAVGESAVSGVSLVDSISVLIIQIMGALATGGAVISAQYLGKEQPRDARKAAGQLILVTMLVSVIIAGTAVGRVRVVTDDKGRTVKTAGPSIPVEITGLADVPSPGDEFNAVSDERMARELVEQRRQAEKDAAAKLNTKVTLDNLFAKMQEGEMKDLNLIVKADVQGSAEALKASLLKLSNEEVRVKVIHTGVGAINESDVSLASASNAIIIGFNIRPDATAKSIAEREKVDIRLYKVIYQAIEDVEAAMKGMLDPVFEEKIIGHAVIRQTFKASGIGTIAGSYVLDGKFQRNCSCRVKRDGEQIFEGPLASLKRFKDDVKEVAAGYECGLVFEKFNDLQEDDEIEAYIMVEVPR